MPVRVQISYSKIHFKRIVKVSLLSDKIEMKDTLDMYPLSEVNFFMMFFLKAGDSILIRIPFHTYYAEKI